MKLFILSGDIKHLEKKLLESQEMPRCNYTHKTLCFGLSTYYFDKYTYLGTKQKYVRLEYPTAVIYNQVVFWYVFLNQQSCMNEYGILIKSEKKSSRI